MAAIPATHAHFTRHSKKKTSDSLLVDPVLVEEKEIQLGFGVSGIHFYVCRQVLVGWSECWLAVRGTVEGWRGKWARNQVET